MKKQIQHLAIIFIFLFIATNLVRAQGEAGQEKVTKSELKKLKKAVEKNPDSLSFHQAYIKALGKDESTMEKQYAEWMKKYPNSAIVPYAIGKAFENKESPKAKPYLLKTVEIDPNYTEAWGGLWIDGERWGDFVQAREYLSKATASDPSNPNYAFYYASSFDGVDRAQYIKKSLDVVKRFPESERGAQALYWLGERSKNVKDKIKFFEMLRSKYSPTKFNWSSSGMSSYYNILLTENTQKAFDLAQEMAKDEKKAKEWTGLASQAKMVLDAKKFIQEGKGKEALALINEVKLPRYYSFNNELTLIKAQAMDVDGNFNEAYHSLIEAFAKKPTDQMNAALLAYGIKLSKSSAQVKDDIWKQLNLIAKTATPFKLKGYFSDDYTSLADYKGKVVLLTYWFPGCGPCRGEFPHLQTVVNKFNEDDLAYVGINIVSDQNDYVIPFMKSSGYTFTPLEDVEGRDKGNLDNGRAAPVNFLIDQKGRIIFTNFMINGNNENELELMINLLVNHKNV